MEEFAGHVSNLGNQDMYTEFWEEDFFEED
jgi:hypothetical protein